MYTCKDGAFRMDVEGYVQSSFRSPNGLTFFRFLSDAYWSVTIRAFTRASSGVRPPLLPTPLVFFFRSCAGSWRDVLGRYRTTVRWQCFVSAVSPLKHGGAVLKYRGLMSSDPQKGVCIN